MITGRSLALRLTLPCGVLALWELLYRTGVMPANVLSAPSLIAIRMWAMLLNGSLLANASHSLFLVLASFGLACLIGIPIGVAMGANQSLESLLYPMIELVRPIPPLALLPLALVWLGIGVSEKLFILLVGTFPPIVINTFHGVRATDRVLVRVARSMGARNSDILWKVLVPTALPSMFIGMRVASGFAFTVIVAAELVATDRGLGYLLSIGWRTFDLETIFVAIFAISLLSYLMDWVLRAVRSAVIKWEDDEDMPTAVL